MTPDEKLDKALEILTEVRVSQARIETTVDANTARIKKLEDVAEDYKANKNKVKGGYFATTILGGMLVGLWQWLTSH